MLFVSRIKPEGFAVRCSSKQYVEQSNRIYTISYETHWIADEFPSSSTKWACLMYRSTRLEPNFAKCFTSKWERACDIYEREINFYFVYFLIDFSHWLKLRQRNRFLLKKKKNNVQQFRDTQRERERV